MIEQGICDWLIISFKLFLFISVIDFKLSVQLLGIAFSYSYCRAGCTRNLKKSIYCQPVLLFSIKGQNFSGRYLSVWNHCLNNFGHYSRPELGLKPEAHHSKLLISWAGISRDAAKTRFDHSLSPSSLHIPSWYPSDLSRILIKGEVIDKKNKREGYKTAWCFSFAEMVLYLVVPGSSSSATTDRSSMPTWFKKKT